MGKTHRSAEIPRPVQSGRGSMHISAAERYARNNRQLPGHVTAHHFPLRGDPGADRKSVLEEFVPSAADAIEVVKGRVVLVDGTLTPC